MPLPQGLLRHRFQSSIFSKGLAIVLVPAAINLAVLWGTWRTSRDQALGQARLAHSRDVIDAAQRVLTRLVDAETAIRGFLLTGERLFLQPYDEPGTRESLQRLSRLVADDREQAHTARLITNGAEALLRGFADTLGTAADPAHRAERTSRALLAKADMDGLRDLIATVRQDQARVVLERQAAFDRRRTRLDALITTGAVATLASMIGLVFVFHRGIARRLGQLTGNAERLATGRPLLERLKGDDELAILDRTFREMAAELERRRGARMRGLHEAAALVTSTGGSADAQARAIADQARELAAAGWAQVTLDAESALIPARPVISGVDPGPSAERLSTPLLTIGREPLGRLDVARAGEGDFTDEERAALTQLALAAGAAIEVRRAQAALDRRARELAAVNRELSERNQENELFVYSVSHDLRSPLVNLEGFSKELSITTAEIRELLHEPGVPPPLRERGVALVDGAVDESVQFIRAAVARLSRIIDALLRLSRAGRVEFRPVMLDLDALVTRLVDSMRNTIEERGAVVRVGPLGQVTGDAAAVEQVFANLIDNALKYLSPLRSGVIEVDRAEVADGARGSGWVTVCVRDNGLGIPEAYRQKVFRPLQRIHVDAAPGEGMGLAIVRRVVERHGGDVTLDSQVGVGTTFRVTLAAGRPGVS